jgi:hypothetical protein
MQLYSHMYYAVQSTLNGPLLLKGPCLQACLQMACVGNTVTVGQQVHQRWKAGMNSSANLIAKDVTLIEQFIMSRPFQSSVHIVATVNHCRQ